MTVDDGEEGAITLPGGMDRRFVALDDLRGNGGDGDGASDHRVTPAVSSVGDEVEGSIGDHQCGGCGCGRSENDEDVDGDGDGDPHPRTLPHRPSPLAAFWIMGLLNNAAYVIMIASAKSISEGGTAAVFLANILPTLLVKLTAPFWFDRVGYGCRMAAASMLMAGSFFVVGHYSWVAEAEEDSSEDGKRGERSSGGSLLIVTMELIGVALGSFQAGLGEASLLALAGRYDSQKVAASTSEGEKKTTGWCITAFSSGTGLAGVFGFAYKVALTDWMGMSLSSALLVANVLAASYWYTFRRFLLEGASEGEGPEEEQRGETFREEQQLTQQRPFATTVPVGSERGVELHLLQEGSDEEDHEDTSNGSETASQGLFAKIKRRKKQARKRGYTGLGTSDDGEDCEASPRLTCSGRNGAIDVAVAAEADWSEDDCTENQLGTDAWRIEAPDIKSLSAWGRLRLTLSLWPYMVPLFTVYAAEYALQSGTWTAIGFPVDDAQARDKFFEYSNWTYQAGVFVSRSSGTLLTASLPFLWLMPLLQCANLAYFYRVAATQSSPIFGYNFSLLAPCFYTGLLGGAVYVNAYNRISFDLPTVPLREFALSAASVADSFGIVAADISGLFIQSCLYAKNGIEGAVVKCPM